MANGRRQRLIDGCEYDYVSKYWRPGVKRYTSRKLNKRERATARLEIRNG